MTIAVSAFDTYCSVRTTRERGTPLVRDTSNWILLEGTLDEPVKGHSQAQVRIVEDTAKSSVGALLTAIGWVRCSFFPPRTTRTDPLLITVQRWSSRPRRSSAKSV